MQDPRKHVPFGKLTTVECLQVLVRGEMPDGTTIQQATRLRSLASIAQMVRDTWTKDREAIAVKWINRHPNDEWVRYHKELDALLMHGEKLLKEAQSS